MELVKVTQQENGNQAVSARELHEFLEVGTQFTKWIERMIESYDFEVNLDYLTISQKRLTAQGNATEFIDYIISLDMAKELAMVQRTEKGKQARKYFIECEKRLKGVELPTDPLELMKLSLQAIDNNKKELIEVKKDIDYLKNEVKITSQQGGAIGNAVSKVVYNAMDQFALIHNDYTKKMLFKELNGDIKRVFGVHSRATLKENQFNDVMKFIYNWQPSNTTLLIINNVNLIEEA